MSFFGVELNAQVNKLNLQTRLNLSKNRHIPNLRTIFRSFHSLSHDDSGVIHIEDFERVFTHLFRLLIKMDFFIRSLKYKHMRKHLLLDKA